MKLIVREAPPRTVWALEQSGIHSLLARLYAARGIRSAEELRDGLSHLLPPDGLKGVEAAAYLLADAIFKDERICIVADYDCDGATACAVALRGLRQLGTRQLDYVVPDRVNDGYGLTATIAKRVAQRGADLLLTVDNGIASVEGIACAQALGLKVLVTDHHLPGSEIPHPDALVNPNQPGCTFASKSLAGVGVMFYVLMALRAQLRHRGKFDASNQPKLDHLLPLVALGTVADVVRLDANNRRLVAQGLRRVRAGHMPVGLRALFQLTGRDASRASTFDLGFALGPRINAAGRLADMTFGIELLTTDDPNRAVELAQMLDGINRARREIEGNMREYALKIVDQLVSQSVDSTPPAAVCVYGENFHEGVVGIVASRLKDLLHRPTFVFASSAAADHGYELKGSGRSIVGFHLRDALDLIAKRYPGILVKFGGHAMAAGCTLKKQHLATFEQALLQVASEWLDDATLSRCMETDGPLLPQYRRADIADELHAQVWGHGFAPPVFSEEIDVVSQRLIGDKHLALKLSHHGQPVDGIWFGRTEPLPPRAHLAFRLDSDQWQGLRRVRLLIEALAD